MNNISYKKNIEMTFKNQKKKLFEHNVIVAWFRNLSR